MNNGRRYTSDWITELPSDSSGLQLIFQQNACVITILLCIRFFFGFSTRCYATSGSSNLGVVCSSDSNRKNPDLSSTVLSSSRGYDTNAPEKSQKSRIEGFLNGERKTTWNHWVQRSTFHGHSACKAPEIRDSFHSSVIKSISWNLELSTRACISNTWKLQKRNMNMHNILHFIRKNVRLNYYFSLWAVMNECT